MGFYHPPVLRVETGDERQSPRRGEGREPIRKYENQSPSRFSRRGSRRKPITASVLWREEKRQPITAPTCRQCYSGNDIYKNMKTRQTKTPIRKQSLDGNVGIVCALILLPGRPLLFRLQWDVVWRHAWTVLCSRAPNETSNNDIG